MMNWIKELFTKRHRFCDKKHNRNRCIAFSICDDGSVAIDYRYSKDLNEFAVLFASIHTGKLCEPMCQLMLKNFTNSGELESGSILMDLLRVATVDALEEEEEEEVYEEDCELNGENEIPLITPTHVFMGENNDGGQQEEGN